jgi:hypothetical protein
MFARALTMPIALALAVGCGEDRRGEGASEPAGRVVELVGSVEAAREGARPRPLGEGDPVYRDDTVATGADGQVTILLAHNQARWSLAAGKSRRVDRSAAWRAQSGSRSAFDDERALPTSSAGRHSEPQAAETRATAPAPSQAPAAADEDRMAEAPPPPAPERATGKKSKPRKLEQKPKGDAPGSRARGLALGAAPDVDGEAGGAAEPPMAESGDRRAELGALSVSGARGKKELAAEIAAALGPAAELCAQLAGQGGEVTVAFEIDRAGAVGDVKVTGPRGLVAKVRTCLREKVEELAFPRRREGTTDVRQTVRFEVP